MYDRNENTLFIITFQIYDDSKMYLYLNISLFPIYLVNIMDRISIDSHCYHE